MFLDKRINFLRTTLYYKNLITNNDYKNLKKNNNNFIKILYFL